jgi:hypothetical protein
VQPSTKEGREEEEREGSGGEGKGSEVILNVYLTLPVLSNVSNSLLLTLHSKINSVHVTFNK